MSVLYYFASDNVLEEKDNPYIECLSIRQARERGLEMNSNLLEGVDEDEPEVILFCSDERKWDYPSFNHLMQEDYWDEIGTTKKYCMKMTGKYCDDTKHIIFEYIQSQMQNMNEMEIWNIWLGDDINRVKRKNCFLGELSMEMLDDIFNRRKNVCLLVRSKR
ncbi:MAG: hypothetical protein Q4D65_07380 [Peptostreptococcaceae bacterium]|nr:hypothetical protein [Peptostreptococcaceae bacterium]